MKIGKTQQKTLELIDTYGEFELLEYIRGNGAKVKLRCLNCGEVFERYAHSFNANPHLCPKCHPKGTSQKMKIEQVQERIDKIYGKDCLELLEYKGNNTLAKIRCKKCGSVFERVPTVLWRNRSKGCPECNKMISAGESQIKKILESRHIQYIPQYRFEGCKYKTYLPFDFYLPQHNICIEFQGEQHYKKRSIYYSEDMVIRDKIKQEFCENNGIKLIIIPYWDLEKIADYLSF